MRIFDAKKVIDTFPVGDTFEVTIWDAKTEYIENVQRMVLPHEKVWGINIQDTSECEVKGTIPFVRFTKLSTFFNIVQAHLNVDDSTMEAIKDKLTKGE